jgi:hypothetical protein
LGGSLKIQLNKRRLWDGVKIEFKEVENEDVGWINLAPIRGLFYAVLYMVE